MKARQHTNIDLLLFTTPIEVILTWLNTTQECDAGEERGESKVKRILRQQQLNDISDIDNGYISIANTFEGDEGIIEMGLQSSKTVLQWPGSKDITWIPISNVLNPTQKENKETRTYITLLGILTTCIDSISLIKNFVRRGRWLVASFKSNSCQITEGRPICHGHEGFRRIERVFYLFCLMVITVRVR